MSNNAALFLFLAAASVGAFAFASIVVWVHTQAAERRARDRFALLKSLAEHPSENADRVLAYLREEEERRTARRDAEERKGYLVGSLCSLASGVGLWAILPHFWGVGLLTFLVGLALLPFGWPRKRGSRLAS
jgi:hypothetical protein